MKNERNKKIALVLGGGSARGLAHVGVLKVLKRNNIPIDFVVGTSIGSLIGAAYALDIPIKHVEDIALRTTWWQLADFVISKIGFLEGKNLEKIISEAIMDKGFDDMKMPLAIVATDIENGGEVVLTSGNLVKIIRASCSIPSIFIPERVDNRLLVDGGLKNSVPSAVARRMGADFIIAIDVGFCVQKGRVSNIFQVIFQSIQILGNELNKLQSKEADVAIEIDMADDIDQMAFHRAADIIAAGEKCATDAMASLKSRLKEKGLA